MGKGTYRPIPREEPPDEPTAGDYDAPEPSTVRPPAGSALADGATPAADYQSLRASCRAATTGEAGLDDELAVEAEILRLVMDRGRAKRSSR